MQTFDRTLLELQRHCAAAYLNNPPTSVFQVPCWTRIGNENPLDYIYAYKNEGDSTKKIPKHWHYIGLGLSDIHGYNKVCEEYDKQGTFPRPYPPSRGLNGEPLNGFGFELTFRLYSESERPPEWPTRIMQALAKYVFDSKTIMREGDNTSWHSPLDDEASRIHDLLMTLDPQLCEVDTSAGKVRFIQLVGACRDELEAARQWSVKEILKIMSENTETGGDYLVTDMRRGYTIFELEPANCERVNKGIERWGSDMALVSAKHKYSSFEPDWFRLTPSHPYKIERGSLLLMSHDHDNQSRNPSRMSRESDDALMIENLELTEERHYRDLYLLLSHESAKILPVVLKGRLAHKRHFTFQSFRGDLTTTFVPEGSPIKSLVSQERPFVRKGVLLQVYISEQLREEMLDNLGEDYGGNSWLSGTFETRKELKLPKNYSWRKFRLHLTVVERIKD